MVTGEAGRAKGRRQRAESRKQKAESRKQKERRTKYSASRRLPHFYLLAKLQALLKIKVQKNSSMKIHEYQGKELLKRFGVAVPRGIIAHTPDEAYEAAKQLATDVVVVKAQIHAGGRGKGGGL